MSHDRAFVFDTNALVSALLLEQSVPGQAFVAAMERGKFLVSRDSLEELSRVLGRTKFDRYLDRQDREEFLAKFVRDATLVEIYEEVRECRDPRDDKFLELAASGFATCLITGDADLLVLNPFRGIPILTPAEFLAQFAGNEEETAGILP